MGGKEEGAPIPDPLTRADGVRRDRPFARCDGTPGSTRISHSLRSPPLSHINAGSRRFRHNYYMMQTLIAKDLARFRRQPNLIDYAATRTAFDWAAARGLLDGLPGGRGLNIAHEAVDRHATGPRAARVALRWLGKDGERREFTYRELCRRDQPLRQRASRGSASARAIACSCCWGAFPNSTSPCSVR